MSDLLCIGIRCMDGPWWGSVNRVPTPLSAAWIEVFTRPAAKIAVWATPELDFVLTSGSKEGDEGSETVT